MTCASCAESVSQALLDCPGVTAVNVDLASGVAAVSGEGLDAVALQQAVGKSGYKVQRIPNRESRPWGRRNGVAN
jgi:copper chaperone CopZ